ncbi:MAG: glutamate--cysteine ligase [Gammaproteobacteria bacterium]|nr:glutamate--cysteine ligase [Gammaproteobacteria bacterium]
MVPHLTTANSGPLELIETQILEHQSRIEAWFRRQWSRTPAPFYASVDLRNAGFKLAPVDTNLFPAGFNNLNPGFLPLAYHATQSAMQRLCADAYEVLIIPENHTRNLFYLESVATLQQIVQQAGYAVRIGSLLPDIGDGKQIELPSGRTLKLEPIRRENDKLRVADSTPCAILLNNDLSAGRPEILENLKQHIIPPLQLGWSNRLKSQHFAVYRDLATEFAGLLELDPWLIDPLSRNCGCIDFMKREGYECLEKHVGELLSQIQAKYTEYKIDKKPFVFIKADSGSYGMGVMTVSSVEEIGQLNRKQRTRMDATKEGQKIHKVIIQEGVYTSETLNGNSVAEPVVYMIDHFVIGGFYRVHSGKTQTENLNSPGMHFEPLAFADACCSPDRHCSPNAEPNRFYAYGVIARLALLAAARECAAIELAA